MRNSLILHSDLNCFYASVEMNENPALQGREVAVCGSTENRHGIVLTASYPAKRKGVKTGMANWQALQACPGLICVPPQYELYLKYSRRIRAIYARYAGAVEPFGMDECWLEIPYGQGFEKTGRVTAEEIRRVVRRETGLTVSVGVSFTKVFAKLGSDMKKPDAVTVIDDLHFRETVWPLKASELLYIGPATTRRLARLNIHTIGDVARADPALLQKHLGKNGLMLHSFANGTDRARVMPSGYEEPIQSVGHGITCVVDLHSKEEVWRVLYELAQDVGHRLREHHLQAGAVQLTVKDCDLQYRQYQAPLTAPSQSPLEIAQAALELFNRSYRWDKDVRALTIRAIQPMSADIPQQLNLFVDDRSRQKRQRMEDAVDQIRMRFGNSAIRAASLLGDLKMAQDRCETVAMPGMMYQ